MVKPNIPNASNPVKGEKTTKKRTRFNQRLSFWLIIFLIIVTWGSYLTYQEILTAMGPKTPPVPVVVGKSKSADVPVYLTALGSVVPTYTVTVKTQINGTLQQVVFREGQMVHKGDLLAQIDSRPYQAQLMQYQGQLIRDQALLDNALVDLKRYQTLYRQDSISQQTLATQQSLAQQDQGTVQLDEGLIQSTKVNLAYCQITSPTDGRVGLRLVDPGNFVQTSDTTGIAVINTLNPITVIFTIAEDYIPDVLQKIYNNTPLEVQAYDRQQNTLLATGKLLTIDNQIDPTTGTVRLRAQFANEKNMLFPSQFVNVKLLVKTLEDATVIPTAAVQFTDKGSFVYVVEGEKNKKTVKATPIVIGIASGDKTVVKSGLDPDETVVVEGADALLDGSVVMVRKGHKPA